VKLLVPEVEEGDTPYALQADPPARQLPPTATRESEADDAESPPPPPVKRKKIALSSLALQSTDDLPLWLRHLHWLLVLALFPLALSLLHASKDDLESQLKETLDQASPEQQKRITLVLNDLQQGKGSVEDLFAVLPQQKMAGAFLPRQTWVHWIFALGAAVLFMSFIMVLGSQREAQPLELLVTGVITATIGIGFLLAVQLLAKWSQGFWIHGHGLLVIAFYFVKLIGFSYQAALDPENGFLLSFFGFTFGVGFCEEVVKAMPLLVLYRRGTNQEWRDAFLLGLASGAGFGISEGIMYSGSFYNGMSGPGIYVVRFISCVALHALWTGSVGITLNQKQWLIQADLAWYEFIPRLFLIVGVPMVLHGLYDTLLKKEMPALALAVAVLSFVFLAFQISRLHRADVTAARETLLLQFKRWRRRQLMK